MDIAITEDDRVAIAEVDYIIHHMNEMYLNKIPKDVQNYITITKSRDVDVYVDPKAPLENQGLKEFTLYFLMILNLKYWCSEDRKKEILERMEYNQKKIDEKVYDIFDQAKSANSVPNETENVKETETETEEIVEKPKENFLTRLFKRIKAFIKKN